MHRKTYICSNCLYSGRTFSSAPRTCPSCVTSGCCDTVHYRIRFPSKDASKQRWKEALIAMGWVSVDAKFETEYEQFKARVVKKALSK